MHPVIIFTVLMLSFTFLMLAASSGLDTTLAARVDQVEIVKVESVDFNLAQVDPVLVSIKEQENHLALPLAV